MTYKTTESHICVTLLVLVTDTRSVWVEHLQWVWYDGWWPVSCVHSHWPQSSQQWLHLATHRHVYGGWPWQCQQQSVCRLPGPGQV